MNDIIIRTLKTLIQSAIGAAAAAAITAIGSETIISAVDWQRVAGTAALAAVVCVLMNISKWKGEE